MKALGIIVLAPLLALVWIVSQPFVGVWWLFRYLAFSNSRRYVAAMRRAKHELRSGYPDAFDWLCDSGSGFSQFGYLGLWVLLKGELASRIPAFYELSEPIPDDAKHALSPSRLALYERLKTKVDLVGGVSSLDPDYDADLLRRYDRERRVAANVPTSLLDSDRVALVGMNGIVERAFDEAGWSGGTPRIGFESAQRVEDARGPVLYFR